MRKIRVTALVSFILGLSVAAAMFFGLIVQATTVVDDTFADGVSTNQNLANNSLQVFKSRSGTTRADAVGSVEFDLTTAGGSDAYWAYFTASGSPLTLGVGDTVTMQGTFSLTGFQNNAQDIRFGFFDSKGTRNAADLTGGQNNTVFGDDTGYAAQFFASGTGSPFVLYRRDVTSPATTNIFNSMASTAGFTALPGTGATARQALANATDYVFSYTVSRVSATQTQVTISVTGGALSGLNYMATETSATPYTTFDWFDFRVGGSNFTTKIKFSRFKVDYTPAAPVITTQPAPSTQTISAGGNTQYSVVATGSGLTYQWLKDDQPITGNATATTATLQLNNLQTTDSGVYKVNVTNGGGTTPSDPVTLTVVSGPTDPIPVINQPPQNTTAVLGAPAALSVTATGPNLLYQWFKNDQPIGGANGPTLGFGAVTLADTADYKVSVSNGGGTVTSDPARLTVVSAMAATAFNPANLASGVCTDKPLAITFDQPPKVGTSGQLKVFDSNGTLVDTIDMSLATQTRTIGGQSFRYFPIIVENNTANIYLHTQLAVNKTYYVTIEPGVLTDLANAPFVGFSNPNTFRFATKASLPASGAGVISVDDDGPADFCTIQGAIDFVPAGNAQRVVVNVKDGNYTEIVYIASTKPFITVKGESRAGTVQRYANNNNLNGISGNLRTSFGVDAADFRLENITLHNTTPQGGSQAEAIRTNGLRAVLSSVTLKSFQDTLLTQKSAYVANSYIEGDVDFMWGGGQTYFKNTEFKQLRESLGYYTQIRNTPATVGNVYVGCTFSKGPGVTNGTYLGRIDPDDFPGSQVVLIDSKMDTHIRPEGWLFNNPTNPVDATNYPSIRYWESNSRALDGVTPIDCSQRHPISRNDCSNPLTASEIAFYSDPLNVTGFTPQEKLTALVSLSNLTQTFDGGPKPATVTVDPAGLTVDVTYNGSPTAPTNAGSYTVVATVTDPNYQGSATGTLTIQPAAATVTLSNLTQDYDGGPKAPTVTTAPAGLPFSLTYNGAPATPTAIGNYTVVATVTDPNYTGSATANLNIKSTVRAFPTAEGAGAYAIGGRGGDTYHVTNLNDSGAGSLRDGIATATGPRTIVFDVSGTIYLNSRLAINKPFLTLAGQTAPGDGITIAGWTTVVDSTQHIIIRYLRFRPGDIRCGNGMEGDALWVDKSKDVIVDHVSASWSVDESLSVTESDRVTVQWSFITESMNFSCHPEGRHGYGSLIRYGSGRISYHHNFYAHHFNRNPRVGDNITLDFVNNVIYDWGTDASYSGAIDEGITRVNYIGNYLVAGPNTPVAKRTRAFNGGSPNTWIYQTGNVIDSNVNGVRDGTDTGWAMFVNLYTPQNAPLDPAFAGRADSKKDGPAASLVDITPGAAADAYTRVLATAGSSQSRDAVDARVANEAGSETGAMINSQTDVGGWPLLNSLPAPVDTDGDGIPDTWENSHGLNAADPNDAAQLAPNGYSNLENYINNRQLVPTAATVAVGGRVLTARGQGIRRADVTLTNTATGEVRSARTNSFGYYEFGDVPAGSVYVVTVSARKYSFANSSQIVNVGDSIADLNFTAEE
ncbi:MAG: carboxypeptidase regulatory-like domain-containing protein [Acidobacteria bacterium]|nr:carboxypeptidase regulatory-like domain-containing protein [Acidobacteriota bacterium]